MAGAERQEILIQTIAAAISIGAELPQYEKSDLTAASPAYPRTVGYKSYGEILQVGSSVSESATGDKVIAFYSQKNLGIVEADRYICFI